MGHSDIWVTFNTYTHTDFENAQEEMNKMGWCINAEFTSIYTSNSHKTMIISLENNYFGKEWKMRRNALNTAFSRVFRIWLRYFSSATARVW